jgi:S-adenosylmethionine:tRNA ribosyltransferase-isomerase
VHLHDLDFHLPPELIAQEPASERPSSRLLHYRRHDRTTNHRQFRDLPNLLKAGDLLVFNNTRVLPARFYLRAATGRRIEGLFLEQPSPTRWRVLLKNVGSWTTETVFSLDPAAEENCKIRIVEKLPGGGFELALDRPAEARAILDVIGRMPLPPYIGREKGADPRDDADRERYQTVYAAKLGSVAAPTAGLHFDDSIIAQLSARGIGRTFVTLDVGLGTFKPVTAERLTDHKMHVERYSIDGTAAEAINAAKREGRRVIAVGTTAARVLESQSTGQIKPTSGETGIFIYPPYQWKWVDGLVTNFHMPKSTLIALVAAFVGHAEQRRLYAEAIHHQYRFFSYGDSSFLE